MMKSEIKITVYNSIRKFYSSIKGTKKEATYSSPSVISKCIVPAG